VLTLLLVLLFPSDAAQPSTSTSPSPSRSPVVANRKTSRSGDGDRAKPQKEATKTTRKFSLTGMFANPLSILPGVEFEDMRRDDDDDDDDDGDDDDKGDGDRRHGNASSAGNNGGLRLKGKKR
jgi:hypothetical protein